MGHGIVLYLGIDSLRVSLQECRVPNEDPGGSEWFSSRFRSILCRTRLVDVYTYSRNLNPITYCSIETPVN